MGFLKWNKESKPFSSVRPEINQSENERSENLVALGLAHLSTVQRVGLRDDVLAGFYLNDTQEIFPGVKLGRDDVLVDVGFGSGGVLEFCSRYAGEIIALDVDNEAINRIQQKPMFTESRNISFLSASGENLPLSDAIATKVLCLEVLEHVDDPQKVMSEMLRIGKPGCIYLVSVPGQFSEEIMSRVGPPEIFQKPHHIRVFQHEEIRDLITETGLSIISESSAGFYSTFIWALRWMQSGNEPGLSRSTTNEEISDNLLRDWANAWNYLLDLSNGSTIKSLLDKLLPKSQIFVAQKL